MKTIYTNIKKGSVLIQLFWVCVNVCVLLINIFLVGYSKLKQAFCLRKKLKMMTALGSNCNLRALLNINL